MKKQQVFGLGLLFAGVGLLVIYGIELEMISSGNRVRFWKAFGLTLACPSLLACVYALFFMRDELG